MKQTIKQLEKEKAEIDRKIQELKSKEAVIFDNGDIKIIKWENKKYGDFTIPKGYKWCNFFDFMGLVNSKEFKLVVWDDYILENYHKLNNYSLSRVFLGSDGNLDSYYRILADSSDVGRVVIQKIKRK